MSYLSIIIKIIITIFQKNNLCCKISVLFIKLVHPILKIIKVIKIIRYNINFCLVLTIYIFHT
jgi:hypothetical protein